MRHLRDREFLAVYRQVAQEMMQGKEPFVRREAIRRTLERGKPLYYLSYNRTYTVMLHYMSTGDVPLKARQQRAMWLEIGVFCAEYLFCFLNGSAFYFVYIITASIESVAWETFAILICQ